MIERARWPRARAAARVVAAGAIGAVVVLGGAGPARAADPTTVAPATTPPPSIKGTVIPSVTINRAPTTVPAQTQPPQTSPRTQPAQTQPVGTRATSASTASRTSATTLALATTVAPTTEAPTTEAPTTIAESVDTTPSPASSSTVVTSSGDAASSRQISRIAWTLAAMGVLVGGLTVWFFIATRPAPVGMAGLAEMSSSRWWRAGPDKRDDLLGRSRKGRVPVDDALLVVGAGAVTAHDAGDDPAPVATATTLGADVPAWARDPAQPIDPHTDLPAWPPAVLADPGPPSLASVPGTPAVDPAPTPAVASPIRVAPYALDAPPDAEPVSPSSNGRIALDDAVAASLRGGPGPGPWAPPSSDEPAAEPRRAIDEPAAELQRAIDEPAAEPPATADHR